jgi:integrase/recombinase XerD
MKSFSDNKMRDRLILELMARGAMRIGEVLKIVPNDIAERKILLREPKSGREHEMIFIPQKVADRLKEYVKSKISDCTNGFFRFAMKPPGRLY